MNRTARIFTATAMLLVAGCASKQEKRWHLLPTKEDKAKRTETKETTKYSEAMDKARQLAVLAVQHAGQNGGKMPEKLEELRKTQGASKDLLKSPFAGKKESGFELHNAGRNLYTFGPLETEPVVSVTQLKNGDTRMVAYADGHVESVPETQFALWRQRSSAAALAAAKTPAPTTAATGSKPAAAAPKTPPAAKAGAVAPGNPGAVAAPQTPPAEAPPAETKLPDAPVGRPAPPK